MYVCNIFSALIFYYLSDILHKNKPCLILLILDVLEIWFTSDQSETRIRNFSWKAYECYEGIYPDLRNVNERLSPVTQ